MGEHGRYLVEGATSYIVDAHSRWEGDCLQLDHELTSAGFGFGSSGYKLAVERGAYRLREGATQALEFIRRRAGASSVEWRDAHYAILTAIDQQFLTSSRLVAAPGEDPVLTMVARRVEEEVMSHMADAGSARPLVRALERVVRLLQRLAGM
jgi:hypothetical protein